MAEMLEAALGMLWWRLDRLEDRMMRAMTDERRLFPAPSEILTAFKAWWRRKR
jgi:hypothetical protein